MSEHIVTAYDEELQALDKTIMQMGGLVEAQLGDAIAAVTRRDSQLAASVVGNDVKIDVLNQQVDEMVVRMLALRQPMAKDLRLVVASLRIAADLERMGDYAANVAKRTIALNQAPMIRPATSIPRIGKLVQAIVKDILDAYAERNWEKGGRVWSRDAEVDEIYTSIFRELLTYMMEDPRNITPCMHLHFIAKNIERVGDHATTIAEQVIYLTTGALPGEARPKGEAVVSGNS